MDNGGNFFRKSIGALSAASPVVSVEVDKKVSDPEKDVGSTENEAEPEIDKHEDTSDRVSVDALPGVAKVEGVLLVWSKPALYLTCFWIWVCFFLLSLQSGISSNIVYYAYADFAAAPQINTAFILSYIIGGVLQLPIGKTLTIWGRAEGFLVFLVVYVVGLIITASCNGPNSFAAGYVLTYVGYSSLNFILSIFVADATGLRNRALAFAFTGTPTLCTAFTGSLAAESFLRTSGWRWSYGVFTIVQAVCFAPLALVLKYYERKAIKAGLITTKASGRTTIQSIIHYVQEFDVIGALLLMAAFILFLLPFSLETYGISSYGSATFIAMVVIGILLFPVFALWEKYLAKTHFIKWELLKDRTFFGACVLAACIFFNYYCWDAQFYNFVIVVYNLSVRDAGYMNQIYPVGSTICAVVFGVYVRHFNRFKWACFVFALPLFLLGAGLMIRFRGQDSNIGYIIMCQIFISFGGTILTLGDEMAAMCVAGFGEIPMVISLLGLWSSLGGAIGTAVASAIYTSTFLKTLTNHLPADTLAYADEIYLGGYAIQMTYAVGSETRNAINLAWGQVQKKSSIASLCIMALAIPAIAMWRDYDVKVNHHKGTFI